MFCSCVFKLSLEVYQVLRTGESQRKGESSRKGCSLQAIMGIRGNLSGRGLARGIQAASMCVYDIWARWGAPGAECSSNFLNACVQPLS